MTSSIIQSSQHNHSEHRNQAGRNSKPRSYRPTNRITWRFGGVAGRRQIERLEAGQMRLGPRDRAATAVAAVAGEEDGQDGRDAVHLVDCRRCVVVALEWVLVASICWWVR